MKTLTLEELREVALLAGVSGSKVAAHIGQIEKAMAMLAEDCAEALSVKHEMTLLDEAGLCSSFAPKKQGQPCPAILRDFDLGGEFH